MTLLKPHSDELTTGSGILPAIIEERGYFSAEKPIELAKLGFGQNQRLAPALVLPIRGVTGEIVSYQAKPDRPRMGERGKTIKYETPAGSALRLDVPPRVLPWLADPHYPLYITEGIKKADAAAGKDLCCIDLLGVSGWRGRNEHGGITALADWELVALKGKGIAREVYVVFDSDVMTKREVYREMVKLKRFLELRGAKVLLVYLPPGVHGRKQGLDDYLLDPQAHVWDLQNLAEAEPRPLPLREGEREDDAGEQELRREYQQRQDGLWWFKRTEKGTTEIHVTNFRCEVPARVVRDDGEERTILLEVRAQRNGHAGSDRMSSARFQQMDWPGELVMTAASVLPGHGLRERAAYAFKLLSEPIEETTMYAHLGWRQIDDQWVYLHAAGAIGPEGAVGGVQVDHGGLDRYCLPEPPELTEEDGREAAREAIRRSLGFLKVAARAQTWPVLAAVYTAPFATILPCDFTVWAQGTSGGRKSTGCALALCHFGDFDRYHLPANFTSTPNAVELQTFAAKDSLLIVDDYAPAPDARTAQQQEMVAHRLLRGVGDHRGRDRATKDGKLQGSKGPRCLALVTSELPPPGSQSSEARTIQVEWEAERVDLRELARAELEDRPFYGLAMAGYLRWLSGRMDALPAELKAQVADRREKMPGDHGRLKESAAKLWVGTWMFLRFAYEMRAITLEESVALIREAGEALAACAARTGGHQAERRPTAIFLASLRALLRGGGAYVADKTAGGAPAQDPGRWGWVDLRSGSRAYRTTASHLGWVDLDRELVYCERGNTFQAVKLFCDRSGTPFPGTQRSLEEALYREKLLAVTSKHGRKDPKGERKDLKFYYAHVEGRDEPCWALSFADLWPPADTEPDEAAAPPPADSDPHGAGAQKKSARDSG